MIDEKLLDKREQALRPAITGTFPADDARELIRLARLGLWAEEHGVTAVEGLLSNVSLDWYAQQFGRDTTPSGASSGAASVIHNQDTHERAARAFQRLREALAALPKKETS